jgi:hypothetical protein
MAAIRPTTVLSRLIAPSYTPEKAYSMIASYGDEGRPLYRTFALTGDVIYPVVYSILFSLIISWLFQRSFASNSKLQMLSRTR